MKRKVVAVLHLILIVIAYTSPIWLDWRIFLIGFALYYIQILVFRGCILTWAQYGTFRESFSVRFFSKILSAFRVIHDKKKLQFYLNYYLPLILIALAAMWQLVFNLPVVIKLS